MNERLKGNDIKCNQRWHYSYIFHLPQRHIVGVVIAVINRRHGPGYWYWSSSWVLGFVLDACGPWMAASVLCNCLCSLIEFKCVSQYAILQNAAHTYMYTYMYVRTYAYIHMSKVHLTLSHNLTACRRSLPFTFPLLFSLSFCHFPSPKRNVDNQTMPNAGSEGM